MSTRGFTGRRPGADAAHRLPPGQQQTQDFPVLSLGPAPAINLDAWRFTLRHGARPLASWNWAEFNALPRTRWHGDIHCVTTWSKFDTEWEGVTLDDLLLAAGIGAPTPFLLAQSYDDYDTNVPLADLAGGRALIATHFGGEPLTPEHGGPARLLVPHLYFWKSAKWIKGLKFTEKDEAGFWELRGYHMRGDPWREQRYSVTATMTDGDGHWRTAVIMRIEERTPRMRSYFLHAPLPRHVAGQYVDVRLTAPDGYQARRSYSIASLPGAAELELAIALQDDGEVSAWFHEVARPGDTIAVRGPLGGHFVWDDANVGPVLLVAGGSGIVPLVSIARAWHAAPGAPMLVLHSARTVEALAFRPELAALTAADARFTYVPVVTRSAPGRRIDAALLDEVLGRWGHVPARCYLCGPTAFVEAVAQLLVARGVPHGAIRTERFG